jgi:hypothetical protein
MKARQTIRAEIRPIIIDEIPQGRVREVLILPSEDDSSYAEDSAEEEVAIGTTRTRPVRNVRGRRR